LRILLITPLFPTAHDFMVGRDRHALVSNLKKKGHEVTVVTLGKEAKFVENEVYSVSSLVLRQIQYPIPNMFALFRIISKVGGDFDIHHYYQQEYPTILPSFLLASSPFKVLTIDNFPGIDWFYGNHFIDSIARLESMTIGRKSLRNFEGIIFLSTASMKTALSLEPTIKSKKLAWIPHGIDTEHVKPDEHVGKRTRDELGIDGVSIIFVGRLVSVKGIPYLAKAIYELDKEGFKGHFIIVGDGPERSTLEALKLSHAKIHLLGYKRNPVKYIQAADALVLPSLGEGCPNVVLEAFACGKPVIASKVGGVPDLVHHENNGLLINPKGATELTNAIRHLASNEKQRKRMGKEARKFAERELDWKIITKRILHFYSELVD
jgi:glycosyltransferase involved in cell wall biosynthesis